MKVDARALLQNHIDRLAARYDSFLFDRLRSDFRSKTDPDQDAEAYWLKVESMATDIRIAAFDAMVDDLAEELGSAGLDDLMQVLKEQHIKQIDGDIHVVDWPLSIKPLVFGYQAFQLFP